MREMTPGELNAWYNQHRLPCGHGNQYIEGPHGGASTNIFCPVCNLGLNVLDPGMVLHFAPGEGMGQVIREPEGYVPPPDPVPRASMWQRLRDWWAEV